nr:hypothetical protein [Tanacetum cinerariifolium]
PPPPPTENFSGEPQKNSPPPDLLDPPHHSPPCAVTASKTTTTATTYNTTMAAIALAIIFATQPPQQNQKGAFDSYKDATGCIWFHKHQECVGFCKKSQIRVRLALGLALGGVRLGGSHHHSVRLSGSHHQGCVCFDRKNHQGLRSCDLGAFVCLNSIIGAFSYVVPEQDAFGVAAAATLRLV